MKLQISLVLLLFWSSVILAQNTDIRPNNLSFPSLSSTEILSLNASDGLREGSSAYNNELGCIVYFDGCEWRKMDKSLMVGPYNTNILTSLSLLSGDSFGAATAIADKILVIGSPGRDYAGQSNNGSVFIFTKCGCSWTNFVEIQSDGSTTNENFGRTVDIKKIGSEYRLVASGKTTTRVYNITINAQGCPTSILNTSTFMPSLSGSEIIMHARIGFNEEVNITTGIAFHPINIQPSSSVACNSLSGNLLVYNRASPNGNHSLFQNVISQQFLSAAETSKNSNRLFFAESSCSDVYVPVPANPSINVYNITATGPSTFQYQSNAEVIPGPTFPSMDLHSEDNETSLVFSGTWGRNNQLLFKEFSPSGIETFSQSLTEGNVYQCTGQITPTACNFIKTADYFGSNLGLAKDKLIVTAGQTNFSGPGGPGASGAVYIYKKSTFWSLDQIISGTVQGQPIGSSCAASNSHFVYGQSAVNQVHIGEW